MITPAGTECKFYYEDFNRGRNKQECRLLKNSSSGSRWDPRDCIECPVPAILRANASEHLRLSGHIHSGFLGLGRRVEVEAYCDKHLQPISDPYVGCKGCGQEGSNLGQLIIGRES